jgi:hypothetical protein
MNICKQHGQTTLMKKRFSFFIYYQEAQSRTNSLEQRRDSGRNKRSDCGTRGGARRSRLRVEQGWRP